jgi:hypothetical protein
MYLETGEGSEGVPLKDIDPAAHPGVLTAVVDGFCHVLEKREVTADDCTTTVANDCITTTVDDCTTTAVDDCTTTAVTLPPPTTVTSVDGAG